MKDAIKVTKGQNLFTLQAGRVTLTYESAEIRPLGYAGKDFYIAINCGDAFAPRVSCGDFDRVRLDQILKNGGTVRPRNFTERIMANWQYWRRGGRALRPGD